jgi:signal transduction histidine kinase
MTPEPRPLSASGSTRHVGRLAFAAGFFAMTMVLRSFSTHPGDAVLALNAVPVAIVAFEYGVWGGLIAATVAFGSVVAWAQTRDLSTVGYLTRGGTYFLTGAVIGLFADRLRAAQHETTKFAERVADMRHEQEKARRATEEQRTRLARELHDVVAHSVSVMTVQASAARRVMERSPGAAAEAVEAIERTGREALAEMRRMVAVLRPEDDGRPFQPQPGVRDLETLIEQMESTGLSVDMRLEGRPRDLPPSLDLSAYRIVQESLTNVLKHAGPVHAEVVLRYGTSDIEIEVTDDGTVAAARSETRNGGHGVIGMRERAALFGGELSVTSRPEGGYCVRARLPVGSTS